MNKPKYNINDKGEQLEKKSNASMFDHKNLIKQSQVGDAKEKLFKYDRDNESKRDIASEIDYSDHRSIATSITISK